MSSITGYYQGSGTTALSDLRLLTSGAERLRVDQAGKVSINTAAPAQTLAVAGGVRVSADTAANDAVSGQGAHLQWNRSGGEGETWLLNQRGGSTTATAGLRFGDVTTANVVNEYARFTYDGNFGIGTTNPGYKLDVNGDTRYGYHVPCDPDGRSWRVVVYVANDHDSGATSKGRR